MKSASTIARTFIVLACALASLAGCGGGSDGGGGTGGGSVTGVYTSVDSDEIRLEFTAGGTVTASMAGEKGQPGTYTIDGEKIIVDFNGQKTTFIRDGDCMTDLQNMFGKMCKGGAAGAAQNVSTRTPPPTAGTWVATNEDGEFIIEFKSSSTLAMTMKPSAAVPGGRPETIDGTFTIESDTLYLTLSNSTPVVLKWVNGAYESSAFGLPMKFTKK
jgi:hypothetical protein